MLNYLMCETYLDEKNQQFILASDITGGREVKERQCENAG